MNKSELSDIYYWRSSDAANKGLTQKAEEYEEIGRLLSYQSMVDEWGYTPIELNTIMRWKPYYNELKYELPRFVRYEGETYVHALREWIAGPFAWERGCHPSFPSFFEAIWENIRVFFLWYAFPWMRIRYRFINAFYNLNDCKLLDSKMHSAHIRNRQENCIYYTIRFTGFHYTLTSTRWVDESENGVNTFITGILIGFDDSKTDDEKKEEASKIKEVTEKVASGWVYSWASFAREFNKIVKKTPDLAWERYY